MEKNSFAGMDRRIDREHRSPEHLHPLIREADKKARDLMRRDAIDPQNFIHPYEASMVAQDIALAEKLSAQYETDEPHKKYANVLEAIVYEHIELSNWFGETASTIKTSWYDDYVNRVDLMVEFQEESKALSHLGLAIDVTFGTTAMHSKFEKIRSEIRHGTLGEVKYFESDRSPHKGLYQKLPRVVIGTEREHIIELAALWLDPKRNKELAAHPIQKVILEEIVAQLEQFGAYAKAEKQDALVPIFERELAVVKNILAQKQGLRADDYKDDRVAGAIQRQMKLF